jgi:hypothetical protein
MRHFTISSRILCLATLLGPAAALAEETAPPPATAPTAAPAATSGLADEISQCLAVAKTALQKTGRKTIGDLQASIDVCQKARATLTGRPALRAAAAQTSQPEIEGAAAEAMKAKEDAVANELPSFPINQSNSWSFTVQGFVGLTRVTFGKRSSGTVDQFAPLSGLGTGLKIRYSYVDAKDKVREFVGLSAGLYYEPKVPVSGATGGETAQTLSAIVMLSTFEYIYLGVGLKFASSESAFDRGFDTQNFMLVFGLGADGKTFTK